MSPSGIPTKWVKWIVGAFVLGLVLLALSGLHSSQKASNEREAAAALKTILVAQVDFRWNDRDGNGIHDFWTGDLAGLHDLEVNGKPIALIPAELADADGAPLQPRPGGPKPYRGYYFMALRAVNYDEGPRMPLQVGQDAKGRKVYSERNLGFCAYPAKYGWTGKYSFFVSEGNSIMKEDTQGIPWTEWYWTHACHNDLEGKGCLDDCPERRKSLDRKRKWMDEYRSR